MASERFDQSFYMTLFGRKKCKLSHTIYRDPRLYTLRPCTP